MVHAKQMQTIAISLEAGEERVTDRKRMMQVARRKLAQVAGTAIAAPGSPRSKARAGFDKQEPGWQ